MSNRERWVVYPLLLLTLGIAMRDKVIPPHTRASQVEANLVRCNKLEVGEATMGLLKVGVADCRVVTVTSPDDTPGLTMGVLPKRGGQLTLYARGGQPVVLAGTDSSGTAGLVETFDSKGQPQVQLLSTPYGGAVTTVRHDRKVWVVMGHTPQTFGVFAEIPEKARRLPLTWPVRVSGKPFSASPSKTPRPKKPAASGATTNAPSGNQPSGNSNAPNP